MADTLSTKVIYAQKDREAAVSEAAQAIRAGEIVVIPTETVYGLAANAFDPDAVAKIFVAKGRPQDNPLIVHVADISMLVGVAAGASDCARLLMEEFWPGPLSLVMKADPNLPKNVTAGLDTVAVRLPASELAQDIILRAGVPVAAPSANRSGCLSPTAAQHAYEDLAGRVGLIIDEGKCSVGVESTVVDVTGDVPVILRPGHITAEMIGRACGYMPANVKKMQESAPRAPGMKYRHYAPQAGVRVFSGDKKEVAKQIGELYYLCKEKRPVVFCASDCTALYGDMETVPLGSGAHEAERRLFACLHDADAKGHGMVLFHYTDEMGPAVKNRIDKAAETANKDASGNMEVE